MFRIRYKKRLSEQIKGKRSEQVRKSGFLNEKGKNVQGREGLAVSRDLRRRESCPVLKQLCQMV